MKKAVKTSLKVLLGIFVLLVILLAAGWYYLNATIVDFEDDYVENKSAIKEITLDGFTFLDRNSNGKLDIYEDDRQSIANRADDLLSQMTQEEKIHLLKGSGMKSGLGKDPNGIPGAIGTIVPTPRLGIPTVYLSDGPAGLRIDPKRENDEHTYYCTAFPIGTLLASTWNTELNMQVGNAMGNEALAYGLDVILGPGANIHRHPFCGRNFEYYSEDPLLTGKIGAAMVNGIEANGIGTSVKHYVANNQETNRNYNDAIVSERAMREIYLKGFEIIVKEAQPWTLMSSYNKVNGTYTSESKYLLTDILRDEWGFEGLVMSDWFGGNDAPAMIKAGNDLLEPGTNRQWKALKKAAESGELSEEDIDIATLRILKLILGSKKMQGYVFDNDPDLESHAMIARNAASEGMVLLKNNNTLPLKASKNIALIGVTSYDFIAGGTGSGDVNEAYSISLEQGLSNSGYQINQVTKDAFEAHKAAHKKEFIKPEGFKAMMEPFDPPELYLSREVLEEAAKSADLAIITIGRNSGEGGDRVENDDFLLSEKEKEMITTTCEVFQGMGKKVVVVLNIGGVIETASWKALPDAILLVWQGGQEGGNSAADILSGKTSPSGKLPMTFPVHLADHASSDNFPKDGTSLSITSMFFGDPDKPKEDQIKDIDFTNYEEGIYVGYRHFDKSKLQVSYPFGYGLSYTEFEFSDLHTTVVNDTIKVNISVLNTGDVAGKEVVQIYSSKPDTSIDRPLKELKAFSKTPLLKQGESAEILLNIPVSSLSYWDEAQAEWTLEKGQYVISAGASSRDIRLSENIDL